MCHLPLVLLLFSLATATRQPLTVEFISGVIYDPTPLDNDRNFDWPTQGDFFTSALSEPELPLLWQRDLLVLREAHASTVNVRFGDQHADHHYFFEQLSLKQMNAFVTHRFGDGTGNDQHEEWQRQSALGAFQWQVSWYAQWTRREVHSILGWQMGEQVNADWHGWMRFVALLLGKQFITHIHHPLSLFSVLVITQRCQRLGSLRLEWKRLAL